MKSRFLTFIFAAALISCGGAKATVEEAEPMRAAQSLVPQPFIQDFTGEGGFILGPHTIVETEGGTDPALAEYLDEFIETIFRKEWKFSNSHKKNAVRLIQDDSFNMVPDGYSLFVTDETIEIKAASRGGIFYGIQTLLQLMPSGVYAGVQQESYWNIPAQRILDQPLFDYRGQHLDVARTFSTKETVLRFIDLLGKHKINKFHWHLTDDEGWRIEIKAYPELAEIGGYRGGDSPVKPIYGEWDKKYGGYFTQEEIREVVEYAAFRNVEIIPEVDLPGHSRTFAKVFPQILCAGSGVSAAAGDDRRNVFCASKDANYDMLRNVFQEIAELFPSQYIHIGGDEVEFSQWSKCPNCQRLMREKGIASTKALQDYFTARLSDIIFDLGKIPFVWDEAVTSGRLTKQACVSGWQNVKECLASVRKGYKTVIMPGQYFYIDMKQSLREDGLTWAALVDAKRVYSFNFEKLGFTESDMKNVMGIEGAFWAELLASHDPSYLFYQTYPRICALSEVGWMQEGARDWDDFYSRLTGYHLDRLTDMGVPYRMFPPVVDYKRGVITAETPFEGAQVRYTSNGSIPNEESPLYTEPILDPEPQKYQFRSFYRGNGSFTIPPTGKAKYTIAASATQTYTFDIADVADKAGLWYIQIQASDANMRIQKISVAAPGANYNIVSSQRLNQFHRYRFNLTEKAMDGKISFTMQNLNDFPCDLVFDFEMSPYIEPAVKVTSSMGEQTRFPLSNAADYNFTSYSRTSRTCRTGDHITFTFDRPVQAYSIEVATGLTYLPRYQIIRGRVQTSTDGVNFTDVEDLKVGKATIFPHGAIKAVRIVSDMDGNSENAVAIQDLKIRPITE